MMQKEDAEKIWSRIAPVGVAMLSTRTGGAIHARPMHNVQDEFEGTLWFFTSLKAHAAAEIEGAHAVGVTYEDPSRRIYVSLSGQGRLTRDPALIENFWNPVIAAWFPEGKESEDLALIEIEVERAEYWEARSNRMVQLFEVAKTLTEQKPDLGRHERLV
jgi:general stress protein 26